MFLRTTMLCQPSIPASSWESLGSHYGYLLGVTCRLYNFLIERTFQVESTQLRVSVRTSDLTVVHDRSHPTPRSPRCLSLGQQEN